MEIKSDNTENEMKHGFKGVVVLIDDQEIINAKSGIVDCKHINFDSKTGNVVLY